MTSTSRGRVAIAALIAVLAFGAAFAVHKATAGTAQTPPLPTPIVLPSAPVHASGVALPAVALPALHRPPRPAAPAQSTPAPSSTPAAPAPTPAAPSTPAAPPSGGGKGGGSGPVLVG
ncbi:MAG: hypothetical protein ACHQE6_00250 [Solirubrobacterales bacterium]